MALSDNGGGIKDGLCMYITVYRQLIVGRKPLQSHNCTSLEGQDMTVSTPDSQDQYTGHCD